MDFMCDLKPFSKIRSHILIRIADHYIGIRETSKVGFVCNALVHEEKIKLPTKNKVQAFKVFLVYIVPQFVRIAAIASINAMKLD